MGKLHFIKYTNVYIHRSTVSRENKEIFLRPRVSNCHVKIGDWNSGAISVFTFRICRQMKITSVFVRNNENATIAPIFPRPTASKIEFVPEIVSIFMRRSKIPRIITTTAFNHKQAEKRSLFPIGKLFLCHQNVASSGRAFVLVESKSVFLHFPI